MVISLFKFLLIKLNSQMRLCKLKADTSTSTGYSSCPVVCVSFPARALCFWMPSNWLRVNYFCGLLIFVNFLFKHNCVVSGLLMYRFCWLFMKRNLFKLLPNSWIWLNCIKQTELVILRQELVFVSFLCVLCEIV